MRGIRWSPRARADLESLDAYYLETDPEFSRRVGEAALRACIFLAQFPHAGEAIPDKPVRKWRVPHTPYVLLYRSSETMIEVARLVHFARDWTRFV